MATVVQGNAEGVPLTLETTDPDKNGNSPNLYANPHF